MQEDSETDTSEVGGAAALAATLQAYALDQLAAMDAQLRRRGRHLHTGVHEARKAARRFRAVVALADAAVGGGADEAATTIRRVGKRLSRLRDAHVASECAAAFAPPAGGELVRQLRRRLREQRDTLATEVLQRDPELRRKRRQIRKARQALQSSSWHEISTQQLLQALQRSAQRLRRAEGDAHDSRSLALRHRWRRRVRRLRMQLQILAEITQDKAWPRAARAAARWVLAEAADTLPGAAELHALGDVLGQQQDRALLRRAVRAVFEPAQRDSLLQLLRQGGKVNKENNKKD